MSHAEPPPRAAKRVPRSRTIEPVAGKYKHLRTCEICGKPKGFTRRIGNLTVCNAGECVAEARRRVEAEPPSPQK